MSECTINPEDRLVFRSCVVVPALDSLRSQLIKQHHAQPLIRHPCTAKTYEILCCRYFWVNIREDVARFIHNCHTCSLAKPSH